MSENNIRELTYIEQKVFNRYLDDDEKIFYIVHKHIWLIGVAFVKLSLLLIPAVFMLIFFSSDPYVFLGSLALSLITICLMALNWYNWYSDVFILTNQNIVFVMWDSLVKIRSSRISYDEVESASVNVNGVAATIFKFGDLAIKTANDEFTPTIEGAKNASEAEQQILKFKKEHDKMDGGQEAEIFKSALRQIIGEYMEKHEKEKHEEKDEEDFTDLDSRFEKFKIHGDRFNASKEEDQIFETDKEDDRFEKFRLSEASKKEENESKKDKKESSRFSKYRLEEDEKRLDDTVL